MSNLIKNFSRKVISIILTQELGNTVNSSLYKFKNKYKWFFRLIYGTAGDEEIFNNIIKRIDGKFDIIMVHSSFNYMVPMYTGQLNNLLKLLLSYCRQNDVTLAMPSFFSGSNWEAKKYYENDKHTFDVRKTYSQMGMLSELFRRTSKVKRSIHPTHSICAIGPLADELTKNHHLANTTFGEGSPFSVNLKYRTLILGIGTKSPQPLTQVNSVPDIMRDKFPLALYSESIPVACIDEAGNKFIYNLLIRKQEYQINRKEVRKITNKLVKEWKFKGIPFLLAHSDEITNVIIEAATKGHTIYTTKVSTLEKVKHLLKM